MSKTEKPQAKACTSCQAAKETNWLWPQVDSPKCIYCTARAIKIIGTYSIPASEATARRRVILQDAVTYGHPEQQIRRLHQNGPWLDPLVEKVQG